jgi:formylmethanofuran dehydrogenase subunit E
VLVKPEKLFATVVAPFIEPLRRLHRVMCPRQVLGVRIALLAARALDVPFPQDDKRSLILPEMDGCFADGLMVVSNCSIGHRTLRVVDFGKIAATVIDTQTQRAVRVWPRPGVRVAACAYADGETPRWHAQQLGYARMPDADLLYVKCVPVPPDAAPLMGRWDTRTVCARCGEEVFNARQVTIDGLDVCLACASQHGVIDAAG